VLLLALLIVGRVVESCVACGAGNDLVHKRPITLTEALCGARFSVQGLDEKGAPVTVDTSNEVRQHTMG
jgi:DnaJ-class molecular chaperone